MVLVFSPQLIVLVSPMVVKPSLVVHLLEDVPFLTALLAHLLTVTGLNGDHGPLVLFPVEEVYPFLLEPRTSPKEMEVFVVELHPNPKLVIPNVVPEIVL